jgi:hypothetical protein
MKADSPGIRLENGCRVGHGTLDRGVGRQRCNGSDNGLRPRSKINGNVFYKTKNRLLNGMTVMRVAAH